MTEPTYRIMKSGKEENTFHVEKRQVHHSRCIGLPPHTFEYWEGEKTFATFALAEAYIRKITAKDVVMATYNANGSKL